MSEKRKNDFDINVSSFNIQDLRFLIGLYTRRKKALELNSYLTDREKSYLIIEYNRRIMELKRELKQKNVRQNSGASTEAGVGDIQLLSVDMLGRLGYSNNSLYKEEVMNLTKRFYSSYEWGRRHGRYSNELLSASIVSEVLNHYLADYDLLDFLENEQLDLEDFKNLYQVVNEWSNYYYWK